MRILQIGFIFAFLLILCAFSDFVYVDSSSVDGQFFTWDVGSGNSCPSDPTGLCNWLWVDLSVGFDPQFKNSVSGSPISNGATLCVGDKVRIEPIPGGSYYFKGGAANSPPIQYVNITKYSELRNAKIPFFNDLPICQGGNTVFNNYGCCIAAMHCSVPGGCPGCVCTPSGTCSGTACEQIVTSTQKYGPYTAEMGVVCKGTVDYKDETTGNSITGHDITSPGMMEITLSQPGIHKLTATMNADCFGYTRLREGVIIDPGNPYACRNIAVSDSRILYKTYANWHNILPISPPNPVPTATIIVNVVSAASGPNLSVVSKGCNPKTLGIGETTVCTITVKNIGDTDARITASNFTAKPSTGASITEVQKPASIPKNSTRDFIYSANFSTTGDRNLQLVINYDADVACVGHVDKQLVVDPVDTISIPAPSSCSASIQQNGIAGCLETKVSISGSNLGPGSHNVTVNFGGTTKTCTISGASGSCEATYTYPSSGSKTIQASISSPSITCASATVAVDPPPTCSITPTPSTIQQGSTTAVTLTVSGSNLGSGPHTYNISYGDGGTGTCTISGASGSCIKTHDYTPKTTNPIPISATSQQSYGTCTPSCSNQIVVSQAPSCSASIQQNGIAGCLETKVSISGSNLGPGSHNVTVNFGGTTKTCTISGASGSCEATYTYPSSGSKTIQASISSPSITCASAIAAVGEKPWCKITPSQDQITLGENTTVTVRVDGGNLNYPGGPSQHQFNIEFGDLSVGNCKIKGDSGFCEKDHIYRPAVPTTYNVKAYSDPTQVACHIECAYTITVKPPAPDCSRLVVNSPIKVGGTATVTATYSNFQYLPGIGAATLRVDCDGDGTIDRMRTCPIGPASCSVTCGPYNDLQSLADSYKIMATVSGRGETRNCPPADLTVEALCKPVDITPLGVSLGYREAGRTLMQDDGDAGYIYYLDGVNGKLYRVYKLAPVNAVATLYYDELFSDSRIRTGPISMSMDETSIYIIHTSGDKIVVQKIQKPLGPVVEIDTGITCAMCSSLDIIAVNGDIYFSKWESGKAYIYQLKKPYTSVNTIQEVNNVFEVTMAKRDTIVYWETRDSGSNENALWMLDTVQSPPIPSKIASIHDAQFVHLRHLYPDMVTPSSDIYFAGLRLSSSRYKLYKYDGSNIQDITPAQNGRTDGLAYAKPDGTAYLYWSHYAPIIPPQGKIYRWQNMNRVMVTYLGENAKPGPLVVDGHSLYWVDESSNRLYRCTLGTAPVPVPKCFVSATRIDKVPTPSSPEFSNITIGYEGFPIATPPSESKITLDCGVDNINVFGGSVRPVNGDMRYVICDSVPAYPGIGRDLCLSVPGATCAPERGICIAKCGYTTVRIPLVKIKAEIKYKDPITGEEKTVECTNPIPMACPVWV